MSKSFFEQHPVATGLLVFCVALALRFFYFVTLENLAPYRGDSFYYIHYANNLLEHGVFSKEISDSPTPDSYWAPGYPSFLAICLKISELVRIPFYTFIMFMQAFLGAVIITLTFSIGRFFIPTQYAFIAALLTAFSPHLMTLGGEILSETLFCFLLLAGIYFYLLHLHRGSKIWACIAGIIFGCAYLTNPVVLVFPAFLILRYLIKLPQKKSKENVAQIAIFMACFMMIISLWMIRDFVSVPESQKATSDRAFENLVIGSHSNFHAIWRNDPRDPNNPADIDQYKYKDDHLGFYKELGGRIVSEPLHYAHWYFIQKPLDLWGWKIFVGRGGIFVSSPNATLYDKSAVASASLKVMERIHYWLFLLALIFFFFAFKESDASRKEVVLVLYISLISISAVYVALHADARYSVPMRPEMYLCAVYAIYKIVEKYKHWRMRP